MIRPVLTIIVFISTLHDIVGQTLPSWQISASRGIEKHDKRLFDYSEKESLLAMQPESWGTYHIGLNIKRKVWQQKKISSFIGFGLGYEKATFLRPFGHFHFKEDSLKILRNLNRYEKVLSPLYFLGLYELANHLFVSGEITTNLLVFRSIDHTENGSGVFPYTESTFELDDVNIKLGINYNVKKFYLEAKTDVEIQLIDVMGRTVKVFLLFQFTPEITLNIRTQIAIEEFCEQNHIQCHQLQ